MTIDSQSNRIQNEESASRSRAVSEVSLKNLKTLLFGAETLDNLTVDSDGQLSYLKSSTWFGWVPSYFASDNTAKIRRAIQNVLTDLNDNRENFNLLSGRMVSDKEISFLISDKLLKGGEGIFDPHCLFNKRNIQKILVPKLGELRNKKLEPGFDSKNSDYKMMMAIAKAQLMFLLNIGLHANKGSTGSIVVSWFGQKKIGVFKPKRTGESWVSGLYQRVMHKLHSQISHLKTAEMARPRAEVAAHILDKHLGLGITCPTVITEFKGPISEDKELKGSFQLYASEFVEATEIKKVLDLKDEFHPDEIKNFQIMTILDYLMGDLDGHEENWLVKRGSGGCLIEELFKIDNANSFIKINPNRALITDCKQYVWSKWLIAEQPFVESSKELMKSLKLEVINEVVDKIREELPGFLDDNIIALLLQRARVLLSLASVEGCSPKELGQLQTDDEIEKFLRTNEDVSPLPSQNFLGGSCEFVIVEDYDPQKKTAYRDPAP